MAAMSIGQRIKQARESLNWSQTDLAEKLGISPQAVQQWESGATSPRGKRLKNVANLLGVTTDWLMEDDSQPIKILEGTVLSVSDQILLELFHSLPTVEQERFRRELEDKKSYFDAIYEDMTQRQASKKRA